ncbi:unnamed protein product [Calicophoron daubneyi]|uniref:Ubiquitin carboxyl-terminal hydrolase n=1 Tax=Calicophoron daubneyi TaxID=300641 RepID=A0AAV2TK17_CALDB
MTKQIYAADLIKQKATVEKYLKGPVEGRAWYVIDLQWWNKWSRFIDAVTQEGNVEVAEEDYPGEVDNTNLLKDGKLRPNLLKEEDLTLIPEDVWKLFVEYYGCVHKDTSVFKRNAIHTLSGQVVVEIYPPSYTFYDLDRSRKLFDGTFSEAQTIGEIKSIVRKNMKLEDSVNIRLYSQYGNGYEELTDDRATIGEASLERQEVLYVRQEITNGVKSGLGATVGSFDLSRFGSPSISLFGSGSSGARTTPGVCGLSNLGNTCFMNSAIQCMSNVPELTHYFRLPTWKLDINKYNPIGTRGRIATAYAELIEHIWSGMYTYDVPRALKREIACVATQFSGYAQHDSHELLVFLLDGLHEDLNKVKDKPYVEVKDAGGRPDEVVAKEAWENHKARNDSVIVDLFHGQLKSTVICPTCNYRSVTFDPFASLNLPLPETNKYIKYVYLWPWTRAETDPGPIRYEIPVPSTFHVRDFLLTLERMRKPQRGCQYYLAEVYNRSLGRPWHPDYQVRDRHDLPLFAYELPLGELIPVRLYNPNHYNTSGWVGIPFYISIPPTTKSPINESFLIQSIIHRLRAIGVELPSPVSPQKIPVQTAAATLNSHESQAGDRLTDPIAGHSSSTVDSSDSRRRISEDKGSTTNLSATDLNGFHTDESQMNNQLGKQSLDLDTNMSSDDDPIVSCLGGRVRLTDDHNRELADLTGSRMINFQTFERIPCRLTIESNDSPVQTQLDDFMRSITSTQSFSSIQPTNQKQLTRLYHCFEKFTSTEKLSARDPWYCPKCKCEKEATKKFDLWSLPEILVVQLKRFRCTFRSRDKIDTMVEFPVEGLDLTEWVVRNSSEQFVYDLIAVSNHMGYLSGGHYTAFALNDPTKRWYVFDDASTREMSKSEIVTRAAYVLVYRRRSSVNPDLPIAMTNQSNEESEDLEDGPDSASSLEADDGPSYNGPVAMYTNDDDLTNVE